MLQVSGHTLHYASSFTTSLYKETIMDKRLEKLEVECQVNEDDTIRLEDYPPDKQALVSIRDDWGTSELFISVEDATKIRDWWIAFCERYRK